MQVAGIIAEYNPFHNGHQYHIEQTKSQLAGCDGIIAVMSGNFTQRGEPAIFDKWTRTKAALHGGADLVLELPTAFATRSAGYFARGGVLTLAATGVVSHLSCGVEDTANADTASQLMHIADLLANEPPQYQSLIQTFTHQGMAYPAARQKALQQMQIPGAQLLDTPNNILALEYLQTIQQEHLSITPMLIPRRGNYHADSVPNANGNAAKEYEQQFASATAIRKLILAEDSLWQTQMPEASAQTLAQHIADGYTPMEAEAFAQYLLFLLRRSTPEDWSNIVEMIEGLENRIYEMAHRQEIQTIAELCMAVKSKRYTYTRIMRTLLYILLHFTEQYSAQEPAYLRVLGFNDTGQKMLKEMKKKASLPILIRPARQRNELTAKGQQLLELDIRATNLYDTAYHNPALRQINADLLRTPIQVSYII